MLNPVTPDFEAQLRAVLPAAAFRPAEPKYFEDPRGRVKGVEGLVVAPASVEEVAVLVKACNAARIGIVPYSGGTGLVLGQIQTEGPAPVTLSLERMNAIRAVYPVENMMVAEAGAILADVHAAAHAVDRLFPLSLASEGSCRIGGNLSTNAGGVNVLRYGNARELCLGLEAVLPDGTIWHGLKRLRKDNTGYDLRNLLIGAEGSLGIITAAALRLFARPERTGTALMVVPDPQAALDLLALAGKLIGDGISAFEMMSGMGQSFLAETVPELRLPFDPIPDWMVLIDLGLARAQDPQAALEDLFVQASEAGLVRDGMIAQSEAQRQDFWAVRETIPTGNKRVGSISSHDISIPRSDIPAFIPEGIEKLKELGDFRVNCFGHLGDGNLHYNVFPAKGKTRADYPDMPKRVAACVHDLVHRYNGSVSAEHGVGRLKVADLDHYQDPAKHAAMRTIKLALDPNGIMNPGAVVDVTKG
ncbi:putative FAD-linked oxidoreductase [Aquimixticola soesokkakensis]|uniref:Putative FAD-linked oxidoreductase n=1 Tax=Aquimixticola soesokkakensis TaxID=1519096 RepID=A0A1Y5S3V9_9RHOB|nr:FAD-binding oxidoreductase [Aquimixticola soesokkakensis]SLN32064.1 putative FAD-linked oxidoreductase [Aquimixticola soesokkakensis]